MKSTVWKLRKLTLKLFRQNFRESNDFATEVTKERVYFTKYFCQMRVKFSFFHTVVKLLLNFLEVSIKENLYDLDSVKNYAQCGNFGYFFDFFGKNS